MPTYQGQISEDGLIDLVEFIKNLQNNNHRCSRRLITVSKLTRRRSPHTLRFRTGDNDFSNNGEAMSTATTSPAINHTSFRCPTRAYGPAAEAELHQQCRARP